MSFSLRSHARTDPGRTHEENEDSLYADDKQGLYAVSDGIGSSRGAAVASRLIIETISGSFHMADAWPGHESAIRKRLREGVNAAAGCLYKQGQAQPKHRRMAATLTLLARVRDSAWLAHIGDSRAYLLRDGLLDQLTRDHSLAFEQYELGALTKDQIRDHPNQKLLTRTLSARRRKALPELGCVPLEPGDVLLLCSDGLNKEVSDEEIRHLLLQDMELPELTKALVDHANEAGGQDNISVVLITVAKDQALT